MANPNFEEGSIARRKKPGEALTPRDTLDPASPYGIHQEIPPNLIDGDVAQHQMDDLGNLKVALGDPAQIAELKGVPPYDTLEIDETDPENIVLTYSNDGVVVATKLIAVAGAITTITRNISSPSVSPSSSPSGA